MLMTTPMEAPCLKGCQLKVDAAVATLTMNRDDVRNELTGTDICMDIVRVVDWVNSRDDVAVLILTGAGRAFSAGGNVKDMAARSGAFGGDVDQVQNKYRRGIQQMALAMEQLEIPSIAAINGAAIGAGFDLACMCDLRIASHAASFGETFVNLGIIPGDGGAWFLQRLIGYQRAAELTMLGRVFDSGEALSMGLVLEVVANGDLESRAFEIARQLAAKPPVALRLTKRLLKRARSMELPGFLDLCAAYQGICHNTADHIEAVDAFLGKRPPNFARQ